jgi:hypothetical protein
MYRTSAAVMLARIAYMLTFLLPLDKKRHVFDDRNMAEKLKKLGKQHY